MSYFFFDIDGTLKPNRKDIPDSIVQSITKLISNGHHVFLCTGRAYYMCDTVLEQLNLHNAIVDNGMGIIAHDQVVRTHPIDPDVLKSTLDLIKKLKADYQILDVHCAYRNPTLFERYSSPAIRRSARSINKLKDYSGSPILKIDVYFRNLKDEQYFVDHMDPSLQIITNSGYNKGNHDLYGEIIPSAFNKGTAIKELCDLYSIDIKDTYGFGDSDNDSGMLEVVGHPVVVSPGTAQLNPLAEYFCDPPEKDGITQALKHYQLI